MQFTNGARQYTAKSTEGFPLDGTAPAGSTLHQTDTLADFYYDGVAWTPIQTPQNNIASENTNNIVKILEDIRDTQNQILEKLLSV